MKDRCNDLRTRVNFRALNLCTLKHRVRPAFRQVLECASPLALCVLTTGRIACSKRKERFSLSWGERAGVRAVVLTILSNSG